MVPSLLCIARFSITALLSSSYLQVRCNGEALILISDKAVVSFWLDQQLHSLQITVSKEGIFY
jgi:hypothetical protein